MASDNRARSVYLTALRIGLEYLWLYLAGKILGRTYYERRISALHRRSAERIKAKILERKGLLIKLGQMLSNLSGALPGPYTEVLESLQDQVPARPFDEVRSTLEHELGRPLETLFLHIEPTPIAAASIGQVHRATTHDGHAVAVKVQHADIDAIAKIDLDVIERIVGVAAAILRVRGMDYVCSQLRQMVSEELDFRYEAEAMQTISANLAAEKGIVIPELYPEFCTRKVLTSAFQEGVKINQLEQIRAWGHSPLELGKRLVRIWSHMVLVDGHYHADPHPGNLIVRPDGAIVLLDFGATGRLTPVTRAAIPEFLKAVLRKDTEAVVDSLRTMGFVARGTDAMEVARRLMDDISDLLLSEINIEQINLSDINLMEMKMQGMEKLADVLNFREMTRSFQVPREWVLLQRAIALMFGTCAQIAPELNPVAEIKPFLNELLLNRSNLSKVLTDTLRQQLTLILGLPGDLSKLLQKTNRGELRVQIRDLNTTTLLFFRLGQQFILAISGLFFLYHCFHFYETGDNNMLYATGTAAGIVTLLLLRSYWRVNRLIRGRIRP